MAQSFHDQDFVAFTKLVCPAASNEYYDTTRK